jgi:hypothetical protein
VHRNNFFNNKTNQVHQFPKFTPAWNTTCFGQFLCPSSGDYSLYTRYWYTSNRFVDSFRARSCSKAVCKPVWRIPVPNVHWINSWLWGEELPETCRVSCRSKFGKLVHLVGFIIKKTEVCYCTVYMFTERSILKKEGDNMLLQNFCFFYGVNKEIKSKHSSVNS